MNAAQVLAGMTYRGFSVDNVRFPVVATVADVVVGVTYADDLAGLAPPGGGVAVSKTPDATGHVPVKTDAVLARGTVVELCYFPLYGVRMLEPTIDVPAPGIEKHTYRFQER
jgi:hypothetical protein